MDKKHKDIKNGESYVRSLRTSHRNSPYTSASSSGEDLNQKQRHKKEPNSRTSLKSGEERNKLKKSRIPSRNVKHIYSHKMPTQTVHKIASKHAKYIDKSPTPKIQKPKKYTKKISDSDSSISSRGKRFKYKHTSDSSYMKIPEVDRSTPRYKYPKKKNNSALEERERLKQKLCYKHAKEEDKNRNRKVKRCEQEMIPFSIWKKSSKSSLKRSKDDESPCKDGFCLYTNKKCPNYKLAKHYSDLSPQHSKTYIPPRSRDLSPQPKSTEHSRSRTPRMNARVLAQIKSKNESEHSKILEHIHSRDASNHSKNIRSRDPSDHSKNIMSRDASNHSKKISHRDPSNHSKRIISRDASNHSKNIRSRDPSNHSKYIEYLHPREDSNYRRIVENSRLGEPSNHPKTIEKSKQKTSGTHLHSNHSKFSATKRYSQSSVKKHGHPSYNRKETIKPQKNNSDLSLKSSTSSRQLRRKYKKYRRHKNDSSDSSFNELLQRSDKYKNAYKDNTSKCSSEVSYKQRNRRKLIQKKVSSDSFEIRIIEAYQSPTHKQKYEQTPQEMEYQKKKKVSKKISKEEISIPSDKVKNDTSFKEKALQAKYKTVDDAHQIDSSFKRIEIRNKSPADISEDLLFNQNKVPEEKKYRITKIEVLNRDKQKHHPEDDIYDNLPDRRHIHREPVNVEAENRPKTDCPYHKHSKYLHYIEKKHVTSQPQEDLFDTAISKQQNHREEKTGHLKERPANPECSSEDIFEKYKPSKHNSVPRKEKQQETSNKTPRESVVPQRRLIRSSIESKRRFRDGSPSKKSKLSEHSEKYRYPTNLTVNTVYTEQYGLARPKSPVYRKRDLADKPQMQNNQSSETRDRKLVKKHSSKKISTSEDISKPAKDAAQIGDGYHKKHHQPEVRKHIYVTKKKNSSKDIAACYDETNSNDVLEEFSGNTLHRSDKKKNLSNRHNLLKDFGKDQLKYINNLVACDDSKPLNKDKIKQFTKRPTILRKTTCSEPTETNLLENSIIFFHNSKTPARRSKKPPNNDGHQIYCKSDKPIKSTDNIRREKKIMERLTKISHKLNIPLDTGSYKTAPAKLKDHSIPSDSKYQKEILSYNAYKIKQPTEKAETAVPVKPSILKTSSKKYEYTIYDKSSRNFTKRPNVLNDVKRPQGGNKTVCSEETRNLTSNKNISRDMRKIISSDNLMDYNVKAFEEISRIHRKISAAKEKICEFGVVNTSGIKPNLINLNVHIEKKDSQLNLKSKTAVLLTPPKKIPSKQNPKSTEDVTIYRNDQFEKRKSSEKTKIVKKKSSKNDSKHENQPIYDGHVNVTEKLPKKCSCENFHDIRIRAGCCLREESFMELKLKQLKIRDRIRNLEQKFGNNPEAVSSATDVSQYVSASN